MQALCTQAEEHKFLDLSNVSVQMTFDSSDESVVEEKLGRCEYHVLGTLLDCWC